jgi:topoisomerase IV subunit A
VLNVKLPAEAQGCAVVAPDADHVAVVGENRKLLVFPLAELPGMARGRGVRLQKYRDGGLSDVKAFRLADGLSWRDSSGRTWTADCERVGRRPRPVRPPAAQGLPADEPVRVRLRLLSWPGLTGPPSTHTRRM